MWKLALLLALWAAPILNGCHTARPEGAAPPAVPEVDAVALSRAGPEPDELFAERVVPVLRASCSPCHFPGGKLYDRLPFDDAATVAGVGPGVAKRLEGEGQAIVRQFLESVGD